MNGPTRCASPDLSNINKSKSIKKTSNFTKFDDTAMFPKTNLRELEITMKRSEYINKKAANYHFKLFSTRKSSPALSDINNQFSI